GIELEGLQHRAVVLAVSESLDHLAHRIEHPALDLHVLWIKVPRPLIRLSGKRHGFSFNTRAGPKLAARPGDPRCLRRKLQPVTSFSSCRLTTGARFRKSFSGSGGARPLRTKRARSRLTSGSCTTAFSRRSRQACRAKR